MELSHTKTARVPRWLVLIGLAIMSAGWATAQPGGLYFVIKGQDFEQTGTGTPALRTNDQPFHFMASAEGEYAFAGKAATVRTPLGVTYPLESLEGGSGLEFKQRFATRAQCDAAFAPGPYRFTFTAGDVTNLSVLTLGPSAYPLNAPHIANWSTLQLADATVDNTVTWDAFVGATAEDYVQFRIESDDDGEVFSTGPPDSPEALNVTNRSVVISAHTLLPGHSYRARLLIANIVSRNSTAFPGAAGITAYYKETSFDLTTSNPNGTLQFSSPVYTVSESGAVVTLSVARVGGSVGEVSALCQAVGGSATPGVEYSAVSNRLTFTEGETNKTFDIAIEDDLEEEGYETVVWQLSDPMGGAGLGQPGGTTLVIVDDETPASPTVGAYLIAKGQKFLQTGPGAPVLESDLPFNINLSVFETFPGAISGATVRLPNAVVLNLEPDMNSSELGFEQKFATKPALSALFPAGLYGFTIDTLLEGSRTSNLVVPSEGYPKAPGLTNWTAAQLIDSDAPFTLQWGAFEHGSALDLIRVEARDFLGNSLFASPDFLTPDVLRGTNVSFIIPAGTLPPGAEVEGDLTFVRLVGLDTNSYPGVRGLVAMFSETHFTLHTLEAAPPQGRLQFSAPVFFASETQSMATLTITRTGGSEGEVSVFLGTSNGNAIAEIDFTNASSRVSFLPGETSKDISVPILDDDLLEGIENVRLWLSSPSGGAILGVQTNASLVIGDNEEVRAGTLQFSTTNYIVSEGAPAAALTIIRTGGRSGDVSVNLHSESITAIDGRDFAGSGTVVVFSNNIVTRTILIPLINDAFDESNETFRVTLTNPTGNASLGSRSSAIVTIRDNDLGGIIHFDSPMTSVRETGGVARVNVIRSGGAAEEVTVQIAITGGTALEADFSVTNSVLAFGSNVMSQPIFIAINNNDTAEGVRTVELTLSEATGGARLGYITKHILRILDDEVGFQFSKANYTNTEAGHLALITVVRSGPLESTASVNYSTFEDTAVSSMDYQAASGTLVFGPGVAVRAFPVIITNDTVVEGLERLGLLLSNPTNAQLGQLSQASLYIRDNDAGGEISFTATNYTFSETAPAALITLRRTGGLASGVTVQFDATNGTALVAVNYMPVSTNITFLAGQVAKTIIVPLIQADPNEPTRVVNLTLSGVTGGATLGRAEATLSILNTLVIGR